GYIAAMGTSPLMLAVIFGAAQNIASKSSKYTFFDPTKEMAYIPLDEEQKVKGKAAVDVVGARMGKSGGSLLVMVMLSVSGGVVESITPVAAVIMIVVIGVWIVAAKSLSQQFTTLSKQRDDEELAAQAELDAQEAQEAKPEFETAKT
ncbi:AAA family ATPase, partial [Candidatus Aerophobetes bacterium]